MIRVFLVILTISTAVAAWIAFDNGRELSERNSQIAALMKDLDAARRAAKDATDQTAPLIENVKRLTLERDGLKAPAKTAEAPATALAQPPKPAGTGAGGKEMFGGMAKMF